MSVRAFPKHKDPSYKEAYLYAKNIESAEYNCPEIENVCKAMEIANELTDMGWRVEVAPFEDCPMLHIRAKKRKTK